MDLLAENRPETCAALGLDCGTCIHHQAARVASICCGLDSAGVRQIFFQLYSSAACHPMAPAFELAYRESVAVPEPVLTFASAAA